MEQIRAWPEQLGAVVSPDHPLAQRTAKRRLRDCLAFPVVLPVPDMELRNMVDRIASRDRQLLKPTGQITSVSMVRTLAADAGLLGLLVQENVFQDVADGHLRWLALSDAEARNRPPGCSSAWASAPRWPPECSFSSWTVRSTSGW